MKSESGVNIPDFSIPQQQQQQVDNISIPQQQQQQQEDNISIPQQKQQQQVDNISIPQQ